MTAPADDDPRPSEPGDDEAATISGLSGNGQADTHGAPTRITGPIYSLRLKLLVLLVAGAAVTAMTWIYLRSVDDDPRPRSTGAGVVSYSPAENSQVLQQEIIAVNLAPGWDGTLTVDGTPIPEGDLSRSAEGRRADGGQQTPAAVENRLEFVPGPGKVMESLEPGRVCATARVWHRATGPEGEARTTTWCFTVV